MSSIAMLEQIPKRNSTRVFLVDSLSGTRVTFGELHEEAANIGANLRTLGIRRGDRLAVCAENSLPLAKFYFGCLYAGISVVPIHPLTSADETEFILKQSGAKGVAYSRDVHDRFLKADAGRRDFYRIRLTPDDPNDNAFDPFKKRRQTAFRPFEGASDSDELVTIFTSGSTAKPKGVVHRLSSLVDNAHGFGKFVGLGPENRFYNLLAMSYLGGYYNLLILPYVNASSVVLGPTFDANAVLDFWAPILRHEVNTLWLVPSILSILMRMDRGDEGSRYTKAHVGLVLCGTAPLLPSLRHGFEAKYGVSLYENYGLSETLFLTANAPDVPLKDGSVGRLLDGVDVKLLDNDGREVVKGNSGEIVVKTPSQMNGYLQDLGVAKATDSDGWFATGDIGKWDSDGLLHITGRKKDLIIRGGINISPASIEDIIRQESGVAECAVVGFPDVLLGEDIAAVLTLEPGVDFEAVKREVIKRCAEKLAKIKRPSLVLELADLPKTSSGKFQKNKIRAWVLSQLDRTKTTLAAPTDVAVQLKPSVAVTDIDQAMSIKFNCRVYEMQAAGIDVTVLSLGEAFFDIPLYPFDDLPFPQLYHYSHSRGILELRRVLERYFLENYEVVLNAEKEIIVTAGSKIAIYMALLATINPGDEVIIHEPAWVSYSEQIKLCHGRVVSIPYHHEVFDFDRFITNRTRVIIINNPNNPRGRTYTLEELSYLNKLARKNALFVIADETYSDFLLDEDKFISMGNLDRDKTHTIIVNSISKNFGISGWRLGYAITNAATTSHLLKINQHLITCPATVLQYYVAKHFDDIIQITRPQMKEVVHKRNEVHRRLSEIGLEALEGDSTFYLFISLGSSKLSSEAFCDRLLENERICVVPGVGYGASCDRFVRVSIGTESLERILNALHKLKSLIEHTA